MLIKHNGREVEIEYSGRYEDDIMVEKAYYTDTGEDITDEDVLDTIQEEWAGEIQQEWMEHRCAMAYDMFKDRD